MGVLLSQKSTFFVRGKVTQNTLTKLLINKYFGEEAEDPKDGSGFNSRDMPFYNKTQGKAHSSPPQPFARRWKRVHASTSHG